MSETLRPLASAVEADHHDHDHHLGEVGDGGDDGAILLSAQEAEMDSDDPVAVIEAALIRLKDDVGVLA